MKYLLDLCKEEVHFFKNRVKLIVESKREKTKISWKRNKGKSSGWFTFENFV